MLNMFYYVYKLISIVIISISINKYLYTRYQ